MALRAGQIRRPIKIQAQTKTVDAWGDANAVAWATVKTCRAGIEPISGNERLQANQRIGETLYRVVLRYKAYPTLTVKNRIQFDQDGVTRTLNIESAEQPNMARREWVLNCSEGVSLG